MGLREYNAKRDLKRTPEPGGARTKHAETALRFVVQRHKASHLHYDFRLEMDGVLKSWAVPKGPSLAPADKRLAMMVEDHPYDYKDFQGVIPEGNYGAGIVEIWDEGTYEPLEVPHGRTSEQVLLTELQSGSLKIRMKGRKLKGEFALVRMKGREENMWLLIKHADRYAVDRYNSEDHTPARSPINKALKKKPAAKSAKAAAPVAIPAVKKFSVRGAGPAPKVTNAVKPMLASPGGEPFDDADWLFEIKWDGYRAIAETGAKEVRLYSRNGLSFTSAYPPIADELRKMKKRMVLDGEVVALDDKRRPSFQLLQHPDGSAQLVYYVFDILSLDGKDMRHLPLLERKAALRKALRDGEHVRYCDHVLDKGKAFFSAAVKQDLEGIIAKRTDSVYVNGVRSKQWLKVKNQQGQEAVIGGYTAPRNSREHFGALLLGVYTDGKLTYVGHTGTGFDSASLKDLMRRMTPLVRKTSPFSTDVHANQPPVWVRPELVCNIRFTEWTRDGHMRHPVFIGLRNDKDAKDVRKERVAPMKKMTTVKKPKTGSRPNDAPVDTDEGPGNSNERVIKDKGRTLNLTNLNKVYWPKDGYTKGDVIDYYDAMSTWILPHLKDRPQSLYRTPNGIDKPGFFHKDAGGTAPSWVKSVKVPSESHGGPVDYILCNDRLTLLYLANLGCIELNPWTSRLGSLNKPDHIVMDLDPSDKNSFDDVVEAALAAKVVLDRIGATGFCKTSGSSGLHIYIPTQAKYTYTELAPLAKNIMLVVQSLLPGTTTLERSLAKRDKRKIYLDHLQNRQGQTLASVYSIRPKPRATVSTPLLWKEVKPGLDRTAFTIDTVPARVKKMGDLFEGVHAKGLDLRSCMSALDELLDQPEQKKSAAPKKAAPKKPVKR